MENRIRHIDALRGLAMVMVVYHHVILRMFDTSSLMNDVCVYWRMPLFFFISGFLCGGSYDGALLRKRVSNRLRYQLMPTVVMALVYCLVFSFPISELVMSSWKKGFWFPLVLVEISLLYMDFSWLMRRGGLSVVEQIMGLLLLSVACAVARVGMGYAHDISTDTVLDLLSLREAFYYAPYFFLGAIARLCPKRWSGLAANWWIVGMSVVAFVLACKWQSFDFTLPYIKGCIGIVAAWGVFRLIHSELADTRVMSIMEGIGRSTLPIYLLHYFAIDVLVSIGIDEIIIDGLKPTVVAMLQTIITLIVLLACVAISRLLRRWPIVHKIALGRL